MVFVLDRHKKPLMPCTEKRARLLLERGRAVVHRMAPFTIRLKDRTLEESQIQPLRLKLDPGAKVTGFAVLREDSPDRSTAVILGEIHHKPGTKDRLDERRAIRRGRRNRKTRYRKPRFLNRRRKDGWLAPSLEARVNQTMNAVHKLCRSLPILAISTEHVKFDTQLLQNPEISGIEYQQGTLFGYEVKEYLLEKWNHRCAYCEAGNVPLETEHVIPRNPRHGPKGTDRISNLVMACRECNRAKDNKQPEDWLEELRKSKKAIDRRRAKNLPRVLKQLKEPLKDVAMMNATRWRLYERLKKTGLPVECGTGARTKYQRIQYGLPKEHYFDAMCVGASTPEAFDWYPSYVQVWSAKGRGRRQVCRTDRYGFPARHLSRRKQYCGFQTGDLVMAVIPKGKYKGVWKGRVAIRASGSFDIFVQDVRSVQGVSYSYCRVLQRNDGWQYALERTSPWERRKLALLPMALARGLRATMIVECSSLRNFQTKK